MLERIRAGRLRDDTRRPIVLVATQCIEAGADFDFDALVTECASLDALRQRFGRLDRVGELEAIGQADVRAEVLVRSDQADGKEADPVYGGALAATWAWLAQQGERVDFGITALRLPPPEQLNALVPAPAHAPVMLPAHLDAWVQTSPRPRPDPEVALWLHGPERRDADVQIVWRADVEEDLAKAAAGDAEAREALLARLAACPPGSLEALPLPIHAARRWLAGASAVDVADVAVADGEPQPEGETTRPAVRWRGDESEIVGTAENPLTMLRPGDTLVVPASYGGIWSHTWDPHADEAVLDRGDACQLALRGRNTVRFHSAVFRRRFQGAEAEMLEPCLSGMPTPAAAAETESVRPLDAIVGWLKDIPIALPTDLQHIVAAPNAYRLISAPDSWMLVSRRRVELKWRSGAEASRPQGVEFTTEDDAASFLERDVTLAQHSDDVRRMVRTFADRLSLPAPLAADLELSAWLHDVGKADPRFQRMLVGASEVRYAMLGEPLAKSSAVAARDLRARREVANHARYPRGYRHELLSVAMAAGNEGLLGRATDRDLVLHLIGSHHGWCRPFPPLVPAGDALSVRLLHGVELLLEASTAHKLARLDSGVADRFWRLVERYGWWGLAWLEAVLRLADHRASEEEQEGGSAP